ncbi:MAG TPA: CBS domain-containing protein [Candidatus Omnitrophota bacterium]|nr:CBS domain-containing protein [Candidatus Omnitrophota bacterium]HPD83858.1 CBS domain-containing protein [Candidatus Omnitrophota bacterium]HRZ02715.1 CBS domain-containing protein [Candidatus Omnitrophota bacterium]
MLKVSVEDIMSEDIVTIKENATIGQAAHLLLRFRVNGILVVKKNNPRKLVGIVTTTDLLRILDSTLFAHKHRIDKLREVAGFPVNRIARKDILKVQKGVKVSKLIAIIHKRHIHTIPVYDGDKLVGVIGRHDILNVAFG